VSAFGGVPEGYEVYGTPTRVTELVERGRPSISDAFPGRVVLIHPLDAILLSHGLEPHEHLDAVSDYLVDLARRRLDAAAANVLAGLAP
jgi:hypothetical protein